MNFILTLIRAIRTLFGMDSLSSGEIVILSIPHTDMKSLNGYGRVILRLNRGRPLFF